MIFRVEIKNRKALTAAIEEGAVAECAKLALSEDERAAVVKARAKKRLDACSRWFKDGSTVMLEVDTDKTTCVVVAT